MGAISMMVNKIAKNLLPYYVVKTYHRYKEKKTSRWFYEDYALLKSQQDNAPNGREDFPITKLFPCLKDKCDTSGIARGSYFHQDLLTARRIFLNSPERHVDIGSRVDGFVAHVASFREIHVIDIRPLVSATPNIVFVQQDFMRPIKKELIESYDSVSCLHALEHFGLGRYGDAVNFDGYLLGLDNLYKILARHGKLYFSVPIGPQRIEFNAHRVFSVKYLLKLFSVKYSIERFSYVDDNGDLRECVDLTETEINNNFGCHYGCGIFEMTKL